MTANAATRKLQIKFDPDLFNRSYIPLLHNKAEFLHLFGSAGSGKSMFAAQREIVESYERRNRKTLVIRKVGNTLKDSVYSELKGVISEWGLDEHFDILKSPLSITNNLTGVEFLFKGLDDPEKIKSIKGVDRVWIEEATELEDPKELRQLRLRLRGFSDVQIVLSYNPINVHHWLNTDIHEMRPDGHFIFKSTYRDNEKMLAVSPGYADYIESLKDTDPLYYKVYGLGEWGQNREGLVYPDYTIVADMPAAQFYGLDFGFNDPTSLTEHAVSDTYASDRKDFFWNELIYETHLTSGMLIDRMNEKGVSKKLPMICDNARPEMIEDLKGAGFNAMPCTKYKGSVLDGINRVKSYNVRIKAGSKNILREIQNYSWMEKDGKFRDDEPKDAVNHAMDSGRYASETLNDTPFTVSDRERQAFAGISL